jgi:hypothetical protein
MAGNFIEQIKKRQQAAENPAPEPEQAKPTEAMTDAELEDAITATRRQLLDAQHQELREREIARVQGPSLSDAGEERRTLGDVLREKQRGKRRTWR